ncbi:hypothetical protein Hanom_Chr05g00442351 [Helianthus anomalus]
MKVSTENCFVIFFETFCQTPGVQNFTTDFLINPERKIPSQLGLQNNHFNYKLTKHPQY